MVFFLPPWLVLLPAAAGLWLVARLYPRGTPRRFALLCTASAAWLVLAFFTVAPRLQLRSETWHPPLVVLAVDESQSYAALGARDSAVPSMQAARQHYEAIGFRVLEIGFADRVVRVGGMEGIGGTDTGSASGRAALPNLQAVLLWSDGRFLDADQAERTGTAEAWPAPVFPVILPLPLSHSGMEVQGERAGIDFLAVEGPVITVEWRAASRSGDGLPGAVLELRDSSRSQSLWTATLAHPAGIAAGARVTTRIPLPASLHKGERAASWILLLRPDGGRKSGAQEKRGNAIEGNDTVPLVLRGPQLPGNILLRPVARLQERGLIDALRESGDRSTTAMFLDSATLREWNARDVLWLRADAEMGAKAAMAVDAKRETVRGRAISAGVPVLVYTLPAGSLEGGMNGATGATGAKRFGPEARIGWSRGGAEFFPAGALRLADLGVEGLVLRAPDSSLEALAWAEEDGCRGLLFWRDRATAAFGMAMPLLWSTGFRSGAGGGSRAETAARWVRGAGEWARAHGGIRITVPKLLLAEHPFTILLTDPFTTPAGDAEGGPWVLTDPRGARRGVAADGTIGSATSGAGRAGIRFDSLALPAGMHAVTITRGGRPAWSGTLRVRDPRAVERARVGTDAEALRDLAAHAGGNIIYSNRDVKSIEWPVLPAGQVSESRVRVFPLAPSVVSALVIALLLSAVWAARKRLRLD